MDIHVYKTLSGYVLYEHQHLIKKALATVLAEPTVIISTTGSVTISNTYSLQQRTIYSEQDALQAFIEVMADCNQAISSNKDLKKSNIPPLFPRELSLSSSAGYLGEGEEVVFSFSFDIKKRPSSREPATPVLNAKLTAEFTSLNQIKQLSLSWKPIIQKKTLKRMTLCLHPSIMRSVVHKHRFPEIRYFFDYERQFIIPLYAVFLKDRAEYLPATSYFI